MTADDLITLLSMVDPNAMVVDWDLEPITSVEEDPTYTRVIVTSTSS